MGACETISAYLDGRLEDDAAVRFEAHLVECGECRRAVEAWRGISARIVDVSNADSAADDPTTLEQLLLVQRAELERDGRRIGAFRLALAASVLLALGVAGGYWLAGPSSPEPAGHSPTASADEGLVYRTDSRSRTSVRLGADTIHLGPASHVRVLRSGPETRLALEQGSLGCEVAERQGAGGFSVEASGFSVRVTGTRFVVDLGSDGGPARVLVSAGTVEVRGHGATHSLEPGQGLDLDAGAAVRRASAAELAAIEQLFSGSSFAGEVTTIADTSPDTADPTVERPGADTTTAPAAPIPGEAGAPARKRDVAELSPLESWRAWVIEGRLDEARFALRNQLAAHPEDAEAWSLLADCERKRASWEDAVTAYDELVSLSTGDQANSARYKAAQVRLGDHRRAAVLLERFVEAEGGESLLVDKARVRLARSLVALGRPDRARTQLSQVIERAADGETVAAARQMLEQLDQE
jgi:hypothetical protein